MSLIFRICSGLRNGIERCPALSGIVSPALRGILSVQILAAGAACLAGAALAAYSPALLAFGAGAALSSFNFLHSVRFIQTRMSDRFSAALHFRLFFAFCVRLALTGIILYLLLVPCALPALPLLLGLGSTVAGIIVWGLLQLSGKVFKEV
ncbi:MAG: ATP synthase subunit I [Desulfovibrio sp.]|jgi:hypothetical protein|nr:ATP synthase subunit I [Desulfovibrio sp.]